MILQGVKLTIQPLGVGYANRPEKAQNGGYVAFSPYIPLPGFDLTTSLRGDLCFAPRLIIGVLRAGKGAFFNVTCRTPPPPAPPHIPSSHIGCTFAASPCWQQSFVRASV